MISCLASRLRDASASSRTYLNQTGGLYSIDSQGRPDRIIPFRRWVQGFLAVAATLAAVSGTAGQFPRPQKLELPAGTRGVEDLAAERLLRRDPPISTALADAPTEPPPL